MTSITMSVSLRICLKNSKTNFTKRFTLFSLFCRTYTWTLSSIFDIRLFLSLLMLSGLLALPVLKKSFNRNLQLVLLFQMFLKDILHKDSNKFFIRAVWLFTYQTVQNTHNIDYCLTSHFVKSIRIRSFSRP